MNVLEWAHRYARQGLAVFPVHGIVEGRCTCGKLDCNSPGKHPIHSGGYKAATTDPEKIEAWWQSNPVANIAIATGDISGIAVVDVDNGPGKDGDASLARLETQLGKLPRSAVVETGGGGRHYYTSTLLGGIKCSAGKLAPSIDIRGDGGYVVAPPSMHISGKTYKWKNQND